MMDSDGNLGLSARPQHCPAGHAERVYSIPRVRRLPRRGGCIHLLAKILSNSIVGLPAADIALRHASLTTVDLNLFSSRSMKLVVSAQENEQLYKVVA